MKEKREAFFRALKSNNLSPFIYFEGQEAYKAVLEVDYAPLLKVDEHIVELFNRLNKHEIVGRLRHRYRENWENTYQRIRNAIAQGQSLNLNPSASVIFGPHYNPNRQSQNYNVYQHFYFKKDDLAKIINIKEINSSFDLKNKSFLCIDDAANYLNSSNTALNTQVEHIEIQSEDTEEALKIKKIALKGFTNFNAQTITFSKGLNIFIGNNGSGKTNLGKWLYGQMRALETYQKQKELQQDDFNSILKKELIGLFPSSKKLEDVINRKETSLESSLEVGDFTTKESPSYTLDIYLNKENEASFLNANELQWIDNQIKVEDFNTVFVPAKEVLSIEQGLRSLFINYKNYGFDKTYQNLINDLDGLDIKEPDSSSFFQFTKSFEEKILRGKVKYNAEQRKYFYKNQEDEEEYDLQQAAEGIKQLGIIPRLIELGKIQENTILFLDEPDNNLSPQNVQKLAQHLIIMAKLGTQIFLTTHNYALWAYLGHYQEATEDDSYFKFFSMKKNSETKKTEIEEATYALDLQESPLLQAYVHLADEENLNEEVKANEALIAVYKKNENL